MKFLFEVRVKPGYSAERYAEAWVRASEIIQRAPGACGTRLHRKIGEPNVLLAIASWDSKAHRDAMAALDDPELSAILASQAPHIEFRLIGEFEEPEWEVLPLKKALVAAAEPTELSSRQGPGNDDRGTSLSTSSCR